MGFGGRGRDPESPCIEALRIVRRGAPSDDYSPTIAGLCHAICSVAGSTLSRAITPLGNRTSTS